jgi:hypothetical protein
MDEFLECCAAVREGTREGEVAGPNHADHLAVQLYAKIAATCNLMMRTGTWGPLP